MNPHDLKKLRICVQTGEPFAAVISNRKKNGELFLNLLYLRGFSVGRNPENDQDLWFLVGIQRDVTDTWDGEFPTDLYQLELQIVADSIRSSIAAELARAS